MKTMTSLQKFHTLQSTLKPNYFNTMHLPLVLYGQSEPSRHLAVHLIKKQFNNDYNNLNQFRDPNYRMERLFFTSNDQKYQIQIPDRTLLSAYLNVYENHKLTNIDLKEKTIHVYDENNGDNNPYDKAYTFDKIILSPSLTDTTSMNTLRGYLRYVKSGMYKACNPIIDPLTAMELIHDKLLIEDQSKSLSILFVNECQYQQETLDMIELCFDLKQKLKKEGIIPKITFSDNNAMNKHDDSHSKSVDWQRIFETDNIEYNNLTDNKVKEIKNDKVIYSNGDKHEYDYLFFNSEYNLYPNIEDRDKFQQNEDILFIDEYALGYKNYAENKINLVKSYESQGKKKGIRDFLENIGIKSAI